MLFENINSSNIQILPKIFHTYIFHENWEIYLYIVFTCPTVFDQFRWISEILEFGQKLCGICMYGRNWAWSCDLIHQIIFTECVVITLVAGTRHPGYYNQPEQPYIAMLNMKVQGNQ